MESDKRDRLWDLIREETAEGAWREPMLSSFLYSSILNHKSFEAALGFQLASKLESVTLPALTLRDLIEEAFDAEKRKALLAYLGITLRERIVNFYAYQDDLRKKGATITADPRFDRALRWEKELRQVLSAEAPIEEELSFLETKRVENTESKEEELEEVEASFTEPKQKRGRPAANSSMEASA